MSTEPTPPAPYDVVIAVKALTESDGWKHLCAEYEVRLKRLTEALHDLNTPANEAEQLRQARGRIVQEFAPQAMAEQLLAKLGAKALEPPKQNARRTSQSPPSKPTVTR